MITAREALLMAAKYKTLLDTWEINTPLRKAHFFAQIAHESGLKPKRENMYYTTIRAARNAFYSPFLRKTDVFVSAYLRNPQKMANYVYANRNGNGNEASGDGWTYRAGGFIGTTGKFQYYLLSKATGIDYVKNPELIEREADSMLSALYFWKTNKLNIYADRDNVDAISDLINKGKLTAPFGDTNGFVDRLNYLKAFKPAFGV